MKQPIKQYILPVSNIQHCQQCYKTVSSDLALKSQQRCDGQILCFTHQMFYTSQKMRQKRLAKSKAQSATPLT